MIFQFPDLETLRLAITSAVVPAGVSLAPAEVAAVAELAKTVERHCGRPQDIEWAVPRDAAPLPDGGPDVLLLQTRPETFWSHRPRARVEVVPGAGVSSIADTMLGLGSLPT